MKTPIAFIVAIFTCLSFHSAVTARNKPPALADRTDIRRTDEEAKLQATVEEEASVILKKCGLTAWQAMGLAQKHRAKINCEVGIEQVIRAIISGKKSLRVIKEVLFALHTTDQYVVEEIINKRKALLVDEDSDILLMLDNYPDNDLRKGTKLNELGYWGVKVTGTTLYQTHAGHSEEAWVIEVVK